MSRYSAMGEPGAAIVSVAIIAAGLGLIVLSRDTGGTWLGVAVVAGAGLALAADRWRTRAFAWAVSIGAASAFLGGFVGG